MLSPLGIFPRTALWLRAGLCLSTLAHLVSAAEPDVTASDLPRIPPTEPAQAIKTFQVKPGFRVELVAAEPLVVDPIAMCFDENSRLFVVEMRDYSERRDERLGRIRMLEDTDGDGRMDRATVFAENLPWPTALCWYNGGLFVGSTPDILYFKDTDGDGKADQSKIVFTGFGSHATRLNVQQLLNSFVWTLDNRIHGATAGNGGVIHRPDQESEKTDLRSSDFSFDPRTFEMRRENGGGQNGMSFDNAGRKFICSNSAHIRQVLYEHRFVLSDMSYGLPSAAVDIPIDGPAAEVFRLSPDEPWRVLRTKWRVAGLVAGPVEGGGRPSGYFTGATGVTIYRGDALGAEVSGDAFIADIGSNLVHRKKLRPNGVAFKAERADDEKRSEFLASTDIWFRPVTFANGPDGALYIADMYREVVEHPWSLPANIKKHLDLNSGNDRGRIYRVVRADFRSSKLPKLGKASTAELVELLAHANGWHRETAARLLYERQDRSAVPLLKARLRKMNAPLGQIHALYSLAGLASLENEDLMVALESEHADVRENALRLILDFKAPSQDLLTKVSALITDPSSRVRFQLAWTLAHLRLPAKATLLQRLASKASDPWEQHAIRAATSRDRSTTPIVQTPTAALASPAAAATISREEALKEYASALNLKGDAARGKVIYVERCASCHRLFGQGAAVGPDLESVRTAGQDTILISILDPNREVPPQFATQEIETHDGELVSGILGNDAANGLTIRQAGGQDVFVPRSQIKKSRVTGKSMMPEGLEAGLKPQDLADLLNYISGQ
jgi:putative membrane-bound dehydrogenase-like protein